MKNYASFYIDKTGLRFGRLVVIGLDHIHKTATSRGTSMWKCKCDCGNTTVVKSYLLTGKRTQSCGCIASELLNKRNTTHGMSRTTTYKCWQHMVRRCHSPNEKRYPDYGGRGIKVCDRWRRFENFHSDMGTKPEGLTLDRIDVNGNYEPSNCRWTDCKTQANNQRIRKTIDKLSEQEMISELTRRWLARESSCLV